MTGSLKNLSWSVDESEELYKKGGIWQRKFPDLPGKLLKLMSSPSWGWFVACWPKEDNLVGSNDRDLHRISALLGQLAHLSTSVVRDVEMSTPVYFAPENWTEFQEDSAWAKELRMKCLLEQMKVLETWTPEEAVPLCDVKKTNGNVGVMNFMTPVFQIKDKKQEFFPFAASWNAYPR